MTQASTYLFFALALWFVVSFHVNGQCTEYACPDGTCIPYSWVCDGYTDCPTGGDEDLCTPSPTYPPKTPSPTLDYDCIYYGICPTSSPTPLSTHSNAGKTAEIIIVILFIVVIGVVIFIWWYFRYDSIEKRDKIKLKMNALYRKMKNADHEPVDTDLENENISSDNLLSEHFDPKKFDDEGQETPPCCAMCGCSDHDFAKFCRFRIVYFQYYTTYKCGLIYVVSILSSQVGDKYDLYHQLFLGIAALISFLFCVYLGYLSDVNGRKRYLQFTVVITSIPYLMATIYPNIWMYLCFLPVIGFVGSTTIFTGLMTTYVVDVVPRKYLAATFAAVHNTEGYAGLYALLLSLGFKGMNQVNQRIGLLIIFGMFMLSLAAMSCCLKESLPLEKRSINVSNSIRSNERRCCKIFIDTMKENNILYAVSFFYLLILFTFQGIQGLIDANTHMSELLDHLDGPETSATLLVFLCLSIGSFIGKILNPTVLCCANLLCKKDMFAKLIFFMIVMIVAVSMMIAMIDGDANGIKIFVVAAISGFFLSWSKLLLPFIYVLVANSTNKHEKGKTFGVLASVEAICQYTGAISVISLYKSDYPPSAFVVCLILTVLGFVLLWFRIKLIIKGNYRACKVVDIQQKSVETERIILL